MSSNCPTFGSDTISFFKKEMARHEACFKQKGLTCNVKSGGLIDDTSAKGCETAYIGRDYTWHTHKCGRTPSQADIRTTKGLGRRFLCIGEDETKKTYCYDLENNMKVSCIT